MPEGLNKSIKMYKIKQQYIDYPALITKGVNGRVNLLGKVIKQVIPATDKKPLREIIIPAASQEDLKWHFDNGSAYVEKVDKQDNKIDTKDK